MRVCWVITPLVGGGNSQQSRDESPAWDWSHGRQTVHFSIVVSVDQSLWQLKPDYSLYARCLPLLSLVSGHRSVFTRDSFKLASSNKRWWTLSSVWHCYTLAGISSLTTQLIVSNLWTKVPLKMVNEYHCIIVPKGFQNYFYVLCICVTKLRISSHLLISDLKCSLENLLSDNSRTKFNIFRLE